MAAMSPALNVASIARSQVIRYELNRGASFDHRGWEGRRLRP